MYKGLSFHISFTLIPPLLISAFFARNWFELIITKKFKERNCTALIITPNEQCAWNVHLFVLFSSLAHFRQHQNFERKTLILQTFLCGLFLSSSLEEGLNRDRRRGDYLI